ncbi:DUF3168 domain-containing protein [Orrella sp. 11846]|uniref:DUF3168 domain-containing protein n=1 Tax=Orrella sp. 11846 TaxID=3409913 RepID=UPI003B5ADF71
MMFAPIYRTLKVPAVTALVDDRIYGSGSAPQNSKLPYLTWFVVATDPHGQLSGPPCADTDTIQIDCWAGPEDGGEDVCVKLAKAVRDALDTAGQANRVITHGREPDTRLFRISLQTEFIHQRFDGVHL